MCLHDVCGHITLKTPVLVQSPKLSNIEPGYYLDGWPPGNAGCFRVCCSLSVLFLYRVWTCTCIRFIRILSDSATLTVHTFVCASTHCFVIHCTHCIDMNPTRHPCGTQRFLLRMSKTTFWCLKFAHDCSVLCISHLLMHSTIRWVLLYEIYKSTGRKHSCVSYWHRRNWETCLHHPFKRILEVSLCLRPYHVENTGSRPITEVKQRRARLVLGWVTAWEYRVS